MTKDPRLNIQVHISDETEFEVSRVPSGQQDFVSVKLGWPISILLFNPDQAKALIQAVMDAHRILKTIELDVEEVKMMDTLDEDEYDCDCEMCLEV